MALSFSHEPRLRVQMSPGKAGDPCEAVHQQLGKRLGLGVLEEVVIDDLGRGGDLPDGFEIHVGSPSALPASPPLTEKFAAVKAGRLNFVVNVDRSAGV